MTKQGKAVIVIGSVGLVIIGAVIAYSMATKPKATSGGILSPANISSAGSFLSGLFGSIGSGSSSAASDGSSEIGGGDEFNEMNTLDQGNDSGLDYTEYTATED